LYGCETWSLTLRDERRLRVLEKRVLKRIFGPKRDKVRGEWRKPHNEELNDLYYSPKIFRVIKSRRMIWAGHVARMEERRGEAYTGFWWGNLKERDVIKDTILHQNILSHIEDPVLNTKFTKRTCLGFGQTSRFYQNQQKCSHCAEDHHWKECGNQHQTRCSIYLKANTYIHDEGKKLNTNHSVFSQGCPRMRRIESIIIMRCVQLNTHHCKAAMAHLSLYTGENKVHILFIQEHHSYNVEPCYIPPDYLSFHASSATNPRATLLIRLEIAHNFMLLHQF